MDLKQLVNQGDLSGALAAATAAVKAKPTDLSARTALFELLCFQGNLDRAEKQLAVLADESMEMAYAASMLKALVEAERKRRAVMAGDAEPETRPDDPAWGPALREIVALSAKGDDVGAAAAALEAEREPVRGSFNGEAFSDLRDGDDVLAPCLEMLFGGNAWWVDWRSVARLEAQPLKTLRDACWMPFTVTLADENGSSFEGYVPTTYVDSHTSESEPLRLGVETDWVERQGVVRGLGRRVLYVDGDPRDLLELRELVIDG